MTTHHHCTNSNNSNNIHRLPTASTFTSKRRRSNRRRNQHRMSMSVPVSMLLALGLVNHKSSSVHAFAPSTSSILEAVPYRTSIHFRHNFDEEGNDTRNPRSISASGSANARHASSTITGTSTTSSCGSNVNLNQTKSSSASYSAGPVTTNALPYPLSSIPLHYQDHDSDVDEDISNTYYYYPTIPGVSVGNGIGNIHGHGHAHGHIEEEEENQQHVHHDDMPSWLRPNPDLAEEKMNTLRKIMKVSHLEAEKVVAAIYEASSQDRRMIAGASEFCAVLVETMDMGATTLIAAAFHYCECYHARQQQRSVASAAAAAAESTFTSSTRSGPDSADAFSPVEYWDLISTTNAQNDGPDNLRAIRIGQDAHQLIKDAARIKRAESAASQSIFRKSTKPSPQESFNMSKMLLSETRDWRALAIRSAACLYRLRGINDYYYRQRQEEHLQGGNGTAKTSAALSPKDIHVAREAISIHAPLASRLGMHRLKNEIEGEAFRILYPRQYEKVSLLTNQQAHDCAEGDTDCHMSSISERMQLVLDKVRREVHDVLCQDEYFMEYAKDFKVTARVKEPYSLWKKICKLKAESILDVPDALALRVVINANKMTPEENDEVTKGADRALCYCVRSTCTNTFKPHNDGRFKDYIANPKPNGYQSLHYTAVTEFDGGDWPFEIQVRSGEMHQVAEFGLAAHWDYKLQESNAADGNNSSTTTATSGPSHYAFKLDHSSDAYLRSVQEWHWQQAQVRGSWLTQSSFSNSNASSDPRHESLKPYLKALMEDQFNLSREHVFVFVACEGQEMKNEDDDSYPSEGQILELPAGACVLDALRESERLGYTSTISSRSLENKIVHNGSLTSVTQQLNNGDIIRLPALIQNHEETIQDHVNEMTSCTNNYNGDIYNGDNYTTQTPVQP